MTESELFCHRMTLEETGQWNRFAQTIRRLCRSVKAFPVREEWVEHTLTSRPYDVSRGFSQLEGFYEIYMGDRGALYVTMRTPVWEEAIEQKLCRLAHDFSHNHVRKHRLQLAYPEYRKVWFELALRFLSETAKPETVRAEADRYTGLLNHSRPIFPWRFDFQTGLFTETSQT